MSRRCTATTRAAQSLILASAVAVAGCGPTDRTNAPDASFSGVVEASTPTGRASADHPPGPAASIQTPVTSPPRPRPCTLQDGKRLDIGPKLASGTEPFWSAQIDGRCVLYATPENVHGIGVWTRYRADQGREVWSGALNGRRFELILQSQPGCSDGMSDERYPMVARLFIDGDRRAGCARPSGSMSQP